MPTLEERLEKARRDAQASSKGGDDELQKRLAKARQQVGEQDQPKGLRGQLSRMGGAVMDVVEEIPRGFNQALPIVAEPIRRLTGTSPEAMYGEGGFGGTPTTVPERIARSSGEMLGYTMPATAALGTLGRTTAKVAKDSGLARKAAGAVVDAYRTAPGAAVAADVAGGLGAGAGGQIAEEMAPGSRAARTTGEIVGGFTPAAAGLTPTALGISAGRRIYRIFSPTASAERAREAVQRELGDHMASETARKGLQRAEEIAKKAPGFEPSLAQRTQVPALQAHQLRIEKSASGRDLDDIISRHARSRQALEGLGRRTAPQGGGGAEEALEPLVQERAQAGQQLRTLEGERSRLAERRQELTAQQREELAAARQGGTQERLERSEEALATQGRSAEIQAEEQSVMDMIRRQNEARRADVAAGLTRIDRSDLGSNIRERINQRRQAASARIGQLSRELGIADADMTVPFDRFDKAMQGWTKELLPSQRENMPDLVKDVQALRDRVEAGQQVTFQDVKALREAATDEILDAVRSTAPGHRKVLANAKKIRDLIDNELLRDESFVAANPELAEAYPRFRKAYFDEVITPFETGAVSKVRRSDGTGFYRVPDEKVAAEFFGPQKESAARQYRNLFGDDPEAMADMAAVAFDSLADATIRQGLISPSAFENWIVKHRGTLKEMPEVEQAVNSVYRQVQNAETDAAQAASEAKARFEDLRRQLRNYQQATGQGKIEDQRRLQARITQLEDQYKQALNEVDDAERRTMEAMRPLQERMGLLNERQMAVEDAALARRIAGIEKGTTQPQAVIRDAVKNPRLMLNLWSKLARNPEARNALRRHVWDELGSLDGSSMNRFIDEHEPSLKIVFGDSHLENLRAIADGKAMLEVVPPPTSGQAMNPDPVAELERRTGMQPRQLASRAIHVHRGRSSQFVESFDAFMRTLTRRMQADRDALWKDALYDPEVARAIVDSVKMPNAEEPRTRLRAWMLTAGALKPATEEIDQRRQRAVGAR